MKKNVIWNSIGSLSYSICQWLITIIVVHLSGYTDAGYLSLAMTTSSSFSAISLFSVRNYQISDVKKEFSTDIYVTSRIITSAAALVMCFFVAGLKNGWYQAACIDAFMFIRISEALSDVLYGVDQGYDRYDLIGKSYLMKGLITVVVFSAGMFLGIGMFVTLLMIAIGEFAITVIFDFFFTNKLEKIQVSRVQAKMWQLLAKCAPMVCFSFLLSLQTLVPRYAIDDILGKHMQGIYSSIASPVVIVQMFAAVVFTPFIPKFSEMYAEGNYKRFITRVHQSYLVFAGFSLVVIAGALLLGEWGLVLILGEKIRPFVYYLMPIVVCSLMIAAIWIYSSLLVAMRKIKTMTVGMLIDFLICFFLANPFVKRYGANGASYIQILSLGIYVVFLIAVCEISVIRARNDS